jgi:hypothetical protein
MSLDLIKQEVRRFLSTAEPEVVCIKGRWGVGKTFAWNGYVEEYKNSITLPRYSYVLNPAHSVAVKGLGISV